MKRFVKNLFIVFLLGISLITFSSFGRSKDSGKSQSKPLKLTSITIIDRNGFSETITTADRIKQFENVDFLKPQAYQKVLRVYSRDKNGDIHSYLTTYYDNSLPKQYLEITNGRALGTYMEWFQNGNSSVAATIIGGVADLTPAAEQTWLFDGASRAWNEQGCQTAEIPYSNGVLEGNSIYYHANGKIWKRIPYHQGRIEGVFETYLENGDLLQKAQFSKGEKQGSLIRYWDGQKISADENYDNGKLITGRYYDLQGNVVSKIDNGTGYRALFGRSSVSELQEYRQGIQEGEVKVFNKAGQMIRIYHVKDTLKHGEEIEYYPGKDPVQPKMLVNWYDGSIHGITRTWYENGTMESQREMSHNEKNGLSTAWYLDGSMMMIEEYDHDKLVKGDYFKRGDKIPQSIVAGGKGTASLFDMEGNFIRKVVYQNGKPLIQ